MKSLILSYRFSAVWLGIGSDIIAAMAMIEHNLNLTLLLSGRNDIYKEDKLITMSSLAQICLQNSSNIGDITF